MPSQRWKSIGHRDGGVVAVETAVVSMFLVFLLFGIVESSFLFKDWLTVSAAARAGARMGASQAKAAGFETTTADQVTAAVSGLPATSLASLEVWIYDARATDGLPTGTGVGVAPSGTPTNNCTTRCLKFTWNVGLAKLMPASVAPGTWTRSSQNACLGDPLRGSFGVYLKFPHYSPLGFFFQGSPVAESAVMWLEPAGTSPGCKI